MSSRPPSNAPHGRNAPTVPVNGKASAASPKLTSDEDNVSLRTMDPSEDKLPLEEDLMQLARLGEIGLIQKLFDSGKYKVTYQDEDGITALHVCFLDLDGS